MKVKRERARKNVLGLVCYPAAYLTITMAVYNAYSLVISYIAADIVDPKRSVVPTPINTLYYLYGDEITRVYHDLYSQGLVMALSALSIFAFVLKTSNERRRLFWLLQDSFARVSDAARCAALGAGLGLLQAFAVFSLFDTSKGNRTLYDMFGVKPGHGFIIWAFAAVVMIPAVQELVFRGIVQYRASRLMPRFAAISLQAVLCALVTLDPVQGLMTFAVALVIGYVYSRMGNTWASFTVNATHSLALLAGCYAAGSGALPSIVLFIASLPLLLIYLTSYATRRKQPTI